MNGGDLGLSPRRISLATSVRLHFGASTGVLLSLALAVCAMPTFGDSIVAIGFNSSTGQNDILTVNAKTGTAILLNSFRFSSGGYVGETLTANGVAGQVYAVSGDNMLYTFGLTTGQILSTHAISAPGLQALVVGHDGQLIGIDFNTATNKNQLLAINPATGTSVLLNSFAFSSGSWITGTFVADSVTGQVYAVSGDNMLYAFNQQTGKITSTVPLSIGLEALALGPNGSLIGIDYNSTTQQNQLQSVDPATGKETLLNAFRFSSNSFVGDTFVGDQVLGQLYAESGDGKIYTFDASDGQILSNPSLDRNVQALTVATTPEPPTLLLFALGLFVVLFCRNRKCPFSESCRY